MVKQKTSSSIADRFEAPSGEYDHFALCIYGPNGVGKTYQLRRMKKYGKGLVIDCRAIEDGTVVLAGCEDFITVIKVDKWKDLVDLYEFLAAGKHDFKWLALDTVTGMSVLGLRHVIRTRNKNAMLSEGVAMKAYEVRRQDYGDLGKLMGELFLKFRSLPMNIIFLAQELDRTDDNDIRSIRPDLTPAALKDFKNSLYLIGHYFYNFSGKRPRRQLWVGPSELRLTKVRNVPGRTLPDIIDRPRIDEIIDYMMGKEGAKKPKKGKNEEDIDILIGE